MRYACCHIITFGDPWSFHHAKKQQKAVREVLKNVPEFVLYLTFLTARLRNDAPLARDLLMAICQDDSHNANRAANAEKKSAGETVTRGREKISSGLPLVS